MMSHQPSIVEPCHVIKSRHQVDIVFIISKHYAIYKYRVSILFYFNLKGYGCFYLDLLSFSIISFSHKKLKLPLTTVQHKIFEI